MMLRDLKIEDAGRMLEWMHDPFVVEKLQTDFSSKTLDDCIRFISNSHGADAVHYAIVNDDDIYMGTVSLKHITNETAEFAITIHKDAMGKGYSLWAMKQILHIGFSEYNLKKIYWCVAEDNYRALRFYDKNGFERAYFENLKISGGYTCEQIKSYVWYQIDEIFFREVICKQ